MLNTFTPIPTLPTKDTGAARAFYESLGFVAGDVGPDGSVLFASGAGRFLVYKSDFAGTNQATSMMFDVSGEEFDGVIGGLRDKGITFDTFAAEGMEWDGDVMVFEAMKSIWFHDPDGNIVSVTTFG